MNASKASARHEEKPDETYRLPCLTCARRARRWRTVAAVSQWVALSGFTVTIGFAASELQHAAAKLDLATECQRAPQQRAELERAQRKAPKVPLAAVEAAPLRPVVTQYVGGSLPFANRPPRDATQDEQRLMSRSERNDSEETQVQRVEDAPAESDAKLDSDSTEVEEESLSPSLAPSVKAGDAGVEETPDSAPLEPALAARDADKRQRFKRHLADGRRLLRQGQLESAEVAFRHALALRRSHPQGLAGLARLYLAKGDIDRARAFAQAAVDRAPHQALYRVVLGDVLRVASDSQGAEAEDRLATRLNTQVEGVASPATQP